MKKNIVILEEPRSGTHLLGSLIEANGWGFEGYPRNKIFDIFESNPSFEDAARRLRAIAEDVSTDRGWVIPVSRGILKAPFVWKGLDWDVAHLLRTAFLPCVWLRTRREDKVAQAVSYFVAQETGLFHSFEVHPLQRPPDYNEDTIAECLMRLMRRGSWHREIHEFKHMEFVYEDMCRDPEMQMARLSSFLGETMAVTKQDRYQKMPDLGKSEYIARFRASSCAAELLGPLTAI